MKKLTLKRDSLAELTTDELAVVVGGDVPTIRQCDDLLTGMYPTLPVLGCVANATDLLPKTH
ncbi:MAG TPA: class I lanthipeptide [Frankiaceae bacterium]|nr:class I lanthipeptide [Frankiaceae bacterium]